jgi:hypothetical protein
MPLEILWYGYGGSEGGTEEIHRPTVLDFGAIFHFFSSSPSIIIVSISST